jgi:creatinine amidohydrolase
MSKQRERPNWCSKKSFSGWNRDMERRLQRLHWLAVRDLIPRQIDTLLLPVGTVEAHGSACIGTDNIIPEQIAEGIAERVNALVAPVINYGITRSLYRYPGGSTVQPETFRRYVGEVMASYATGGFRQIIIMNGHGGNNSALKDVALELHQRLRVNIAVIHWWELCAEATREFFGHAGGHAGTDETAFVMAVDPSLVDAKAYSPDLAWTMRAGADVYPVPGTILLYAEGEGYPNFDLGQATAYRDLVINTVGEFVASVLDRWRRFGL